jgi:hypothetical protein
MTSLPDSNITMRLLKITVKRVFYSCYRVKFAKKQRNIGLKWGKYGPKLG